MFTHNIFIIDYLSAVIFVLFLFFILFSVEPVDEFMGNKNEAQLKGKAQNEETN